jgi:hypothetical protein
VISHESYVGLITIFHLTGKEIVKFVLYLALLKHKSLSKTTFRILIYSQSRLKTHLRDFTLFMKTETNRPKSFKPVTVVKASR